MSIATITNPVLKIGDVIRASLLADRPEQVPLLLQSVIERVQKQDGKYYIKNFWDDLKPLSLGYVGVHIRIQMPIPLKKTTEAKTEHSSDQKRRYILMELQLHVKAIMDGTGDCAKEIAHRLYKTPREDTMEKVSPEIISSSQLVYLTSMTKLLSSEEELKKARDMLRLVQTITKADAKQRLVMETAFLLHNQKLGGGVWNEELQVVMPQDRTAVEVAWMETASKINKMLGLPTISKGESDTWTNTATTIPELYADAADIGPLFREMCEQVAKDHPGCSANFGPKNACMIKAMPSLQDKIQADREEELGRYMAPFLKKINRTWSQITGSDTIPFGRFSQVQFLNFFNCSELADDDLFFLQYLLTLQSINLSGCCQITDEGVKFLEGLTKLQSINLSFCQITDKGLSCLWRLTELKSLSLYGCNKITDNGIVRAGLQSLHSFGQSQPTQSPQSSGIVMHLSHHSQVVQSAVGPSIGPQMQAPAHPDWITPEAQLGMLRAASQFEVSRVPNLAKDFVALLTNWHTALTRLAKACPRVFPKTIPPLPLNILQILDSPCPIYGDQVKSDGSIYKIRDTHVLSLVLQEFGTLNDFEETVIKPYEEANYSKDTTPLRFRSFWRAAREKYGNVPFDETHWALTTKGVVRGSLGKTWDQHIVFLDALSQKAKATYEILTLQQSYATFITHYVATGENIYQVLNQSNGSHDIHTHVKQTIDGHYMLIGGSDYTGVRASRHYGYADATLGVMLSRRL